MASEFEERAHDEARRRYFGDNTPSTGLLDAPLGFVVGAKWAAEQEPSDAEVEAAARALHGESCCDDSCDGSDMGGFESDARAALIAARGVRLGGAHAR